MSSAEAVVQRQLEAYNARDVDAWLATYARDAEQHELHGALLAKGHDAMRARITRNFADGRGTIEMLCVYEVRDGRIRRASFAIKPR